MRMGRSGEASTALRHVAIERRPGRRRWPWRARRGRRTAARPRDSRCAPRRRAPLRATPPCRWPAAECRDPTAASRSARDPRPDRSSLATCRGCRCPASCSASASFSGVWPPNCTTHDTSPPAAPLALDDGDRRPRTSAARSRADRRCRSRSRPSPGCSSPSPSRARHRGRRRRRAAAVVELDALTDAVGAAAEDDDLAARRRVGLALAVVAAVEIRRERLELGGAGVDALVGRREAQLVAPRRAPRSSVDCRR